MVQMKGLEPPCLSALDPKSSAYANFATPAFINFSLFTGWDSWIRTNECQSQSLVPYRLATSQFFSVVNDGARTHDNQNHNLALYQLNYVHHMVRLKGFEPPAHALEGRCSIQLS